MACHSLLLRIKKKKKEVQKTSIPVAYNSHNICIYIQKKQAGTRVDAAILVEEEGEKRINYITFLNFSLTINYFTTNDHVLN